jgi:hypothetical protein
MDDHQGFISITVDGVREQRELIDVRRIHTLARVIHPTTADTEEDDDAPDPQ